VALAKSEYF